MSRTLGVFILICGFMYSAKHPLEAASLKIVAVNLSKTPLPNQVVSVEMDRLPENLRTENLTVLSRQGNHLPAQVDDLDGDGNPDELVFETSVPPGKRRTFRIATGNDVQQDKKLSIGKNLTLENQHYRWAWEGSVYDKKAGVKALTTMKHHMDNSDNLRPAGNPVIIARGPVRAIVQQTYKKRQSGLLFRKRYFLYRQGPAIHWEMDITNTTGDPQPVPELEAKAFAGRCADCFIPEGMTKRRILNPYGASHTDRDAGAQEHNYKHKLFINEKNQYALSVVHPAIDGFQRIRQSPGAKPHQIRFRNLRAMGRERKFGRDARYTELNVPPGETKTLHLALTFHRAPSVDAFVENHRRAVRRQLGTIHVLTPDGKVLNTARASGYVNEEFESGSRWFTGDGVRMNVNNGTAHIRANGSNGNVYTLLRRDFRDPTLLRGKINSTGRGTALMVELMDLQSGKRYRFGPVNREKFSWDLSEQFPFDDRRTLLLRLRLRRRGKKERENRLWASIDRIRLSWPGPSIPRAVAPEDGVLLSDVGVSFTVISRTPSRTDRAMEVQVSATPDFSGSTQTYRTPLSRTHKTGAENMTPEEMFDPGTYYWRARAIGLDGSRSAWTETRQFRVRKTGGDARDRVRPVSRTNPLIIVPCARNNRAVKGVWNHLPKHLRDHFAFEWKLRLLRDVDLKTWIGKQPEYPMILQFHRRADLAMIEEVFRTYPRVIGVEFGEKGADLTNFTRSLRLAARYGRYGIELGNSDGLWMGCQDTSDVIRRYRKHFITIPKSNNEACPLARYLVQFGMYLSGRSDYCGAETEWWNARRTYKAGIQKKTTRPVDWMPPLLMGLVTGSKVWRLEGFISTKKTHAWRKKSNREQSLDGPLWRRAYQPFFTDVIKHRMIPSRRTLREKVKVGFQATPRYCHASLRSPQSGFPHRKLAAAHGVYEQYAGKTIFGWRWVPNRSRNFLVPVLPLDRTAAERNHVEHVVNFDRFDTPKSSERFVNRFYTDQKGNAFSVLVGDTGVITNSNDLKVHSRPQNFSLSLTRGPVERISGTVKFHQYLLLKQYEDRLFLHANNYRERKSTFTLHGAESPDVRVRPTQALVRKSTPNSGRAVKLTVSHEHPRSVARIYVKPN